MKIRNEILRTGHWSLATGPWRQVTRDQQPCFLYQITAFQRDGLKEPLFENYQHGFKVSVVSSQTDKVTDKVTDNQDSILKELANNSTITTAELAKVASNEILGTGHGSLATGIWQPASSDQ